MFKEISRVTGWGTLINHQAFPLLLAAISATNVLWFYPGIDRIVSSYSPNANAATVNYAQGVMQRDTQFEQKAASGQVNINTLPATQGLTGEL